MAQYNTIIIFTLLIALCASASAAAFTCNFVALNLLNNTLVASTIDSHKGGIIAQRNITLAKHIYFVEAMTIAAATNKLASTGFVWQNGSFLSLLQGNFQKYEQNYVPIKQLNSSETPFNFQGVAAAAVVSSNSPMLFTLQSQPEAAATTTTTLTLSSRNRNNAKQQQQQQQQKQPHQKYPYGVEITAEKGTLVYSVNLTSGATRRRYQSADEGDTGILVGAMTAVVNSKKNSSQKLKQRNNKKNKQKQQQLQHSNATKTAKEEEEGTLYYTLGPYGSYALVTQDLATGEMESITPVRDHKTGKILVPMHLFTDPQDDELMAVLTDEDSDEMKTIIAAIREPHSGEYEEVFDLSRALSGGGSGSGGRVMQRMGTFANGRYFVGWFANGSGSLSKLFAFDLQKRDLVAAVDYYEQEGYWRAVGLEC